MRHAEAMSFVTTLIELDSIKLCKVRGSLYEIILGHLTHMKYIRN